MHSNRVAVTLLPGFILFSAVFSLAAVFSRLNIDVLHQGIMLSAAMRVLNGGRIYVGESYYYGPLVPILHAAGMFFFGRHLIVIQLMTSACYGGISVLLWRIWSRFLPNAVSYVLVILSFLTAPFLFWEFHPWSSVYALSTLLFSLLFFLRWVERGSRNQLFLVGVFAALTFWSRQTVGLLLGFSYVFLILVLPTVQRDRGRGIFRNLGKYVVACAAVLFAGGLALAANHSVHAYVNACFTSRLDWALTATGSHGGILTVFRNVAPHLFDAYRRSLWFLLPLTTLIFVIGVTTRWRKNTVRNGEFFSKLFSYLTVCVVSWLQYYPVSEARHYFWSALPLFAVPVIFLYRLYFLRVNPFSAAQMGPKNILSAILLHLFAVSLTLSFIVTYAREVNLRLIQGARLDPTILLDPAWRRLTKYNTPFKAPSLLRGMLGTQSQVDSMKELDDAITAYVSRHPSTSLQDISGWDLLAANYLEPSRDTRKGVVPSVLILSDAPSVPGGYRLLLHEVIDPAFAYQANSPGNYYLFSPLESDAKRN